MISTSLITTSQENFTPSRLPGLRIGSLRIDYNYWSMKGLLKGAKVFYAYLNTHEKNFNPSIRTIARELRMGFSSIVKYRRQLRELGWLSETTCRKTGKTIYHTHQPLHIPDKPYPVDIKENVQASDYAILSVPTSKPIGDYQKCSEDELRSHILNKLVGFMGNEPVGEFLRNELPQLNKQSLVHFIKCDLRKFLRTKYAKSAKRKRKRPKRKVPI